MPPSTEDRGSLTLYCFSPLVTAVTFGIEALLALYALVQYRHTRFGRLSALMLALLALFQLAETMICRGGSDVWRQVAWISITFLPVIGVHLTSLVTGRNRFWVALGYGLGTLFVAVFVLNSSVVSAVSCPGNYVSFLPPSVVFHTAYFAYYAVFTSLGIGMLFRSWLRGGVHHRLTGWMLIGYGSYIIPTAVIYAFLPAPPEFFPSVFCGFAVFLAVIFVTKVLPAARGVK